MKKEIKQIITEFSGKTFSEGTFIPWFEKVLTLLADEAYNKGWEHCDLKHEANQPVIEERINNLKEELYKLQLELLK